MQCPCTPGIVAIVLEQLSSTPPSDYQLDARTVFDPVLTVSLRYFQAAADASATLADPSPLLRALLLSAPVAEGARTPRYIERWHRSLKVASLTQALAKRSGLVALETAWLAGLTHNLADYAQLLPDMEGEVLDETALSAVSAAWVGGLDPEGWLADAVRYHTLPLTRTKTAHPLIKILQLAYLLVTRPQAIDSVDVRTGLNAFGISPADGTSLLADAEAHVQQLAQRYGLGDAQLSYTPGYGQLARAYANQAAQSAIHAYLRSADQLVPLQQALHAGLRTLFGIDRVCLFVPHTDGMLRVSPVFDPPVALSGLAVAQDDNHSILSLAMVKMQPMRFALNEPDFSVVDAQIARVLGVSSYLCQPVMIGKGQHALLLCGEMEHHIAPLWRSFILEWDHAHMRIEAPPAFNFNVSSDVISRDRVRRAIHEIANPLTNMRNYVTLLSARPGTDAAVQRDLSIIGDEIERVARIVRDITNVEDAPAAPSNMELVSVNTMVSELVRMTIGTLLAPNKISVQIDLNPEVQPMPLQKDQLKQVLFNLAKNAVEAMGQGGHLTLTTRLINLHGMGQVEIEVADTGPGLPEHMRENLFEAISSQKGGDHAGLGLGISHKLITQMGGSIDFITSGSGTRFLVRLPTVQAHQRSLRNASI